MIVRVWGIVNDQEITFSPVANRPGYWEGYAEGKPGLQDIEIWAENHLGTRGHLHVEVSVEWLTRTRARLLIHPYMVKLLR